MENRKTFYTLCPFYYFFPFYVVFPFVSIQKLFFFEVILRNFSIRKNKGSKRKNFVLIGQSSLCFFVWKNCAKERGKRKAEGGREKAETKACAEASI